MLMPTYLFENEFVQYADILSKYSIDTKTFKKGETIIQTGELREYSYFVIKGLACFSFAGDKQEDKISNFRGEGTIFPLYYSYKITSMEQHMVVTAFSDLEVLVINKEDLCTIMLRYPSFAITMSDVYCKYANALLYETNAHKSDKMLLKFCNFLFIYMTHVDTLGLLPETYQEIGSIIGMKDSYLEKSVSQLQEKKIIKVYKNSIEVIDMDGLYEMCSGEIKTGVVI